MKIQSIINKTGKPEIYEKGSSFMWTDPYIAQQLLQVHLNPDIDLASRKSTTIEKTVQWILKNENGTSKLDILDLGCGPGLYTERFAKEGHNVRGIDISENSINYASQSAKDKNLTIEYQNKSYLEIDLGEEKYDLIVLIYTDLGALIPKEREVLLRKIFKALRQGGTFIFDVLNDKEYTDKVSPKEWESAEAGFWKGTPYVALTESFLYEQEKVILSQHTIYDDDTIEIYRFWTHFFSQSDILEILQPIGFQSITFRNDILPESDMWNGDNVNFTRCKKL
ncbi:class I SAM-dependent methyltransferase [Flammeovirga aprica]|uniref:Class I SAM-dependent methyltransferase n=1 Tax=Flammeovirga aprica JL-4 TaxID=694437 RepID=A0A7X9NZJ5_9BACT|nr:class I SAM-dependent methyltransferase [Flammeovirga aprica]NME66816.1 class I SAM-dependent methyltransferase [Flammeovirga aprica JL-4]